MISLHSITLNIFLTSYTLSFPHFFFNVSKLQNCSAKWDSPAPDWLLALLAADMKEAAVRFCWEALLVSM
jgi:hypothetical protein